MEIAQVSLLVREYDEAIDFFTVKLGFQLIEDTKLGKTKRWVVVHPKDAEGCNILLAKADNPEQLAAVGNQSGGRVFLFLNTDDFWVTFKYMKEKEVEFIEAPRMEPYGTVAVFKDLYGNLWDLIEPI